MAGGAEPHARIIGHAYFSMRLALRGGPCTAYTDALRILIEAADLFAYPDLSVVCGEARFFDARRTTLLNPTVLVEGLSPSTETYDRATKWSFYSQIPELLAYVLVSQDSPGVDVYTRDGDGWRIDRATAGTVAIPPLDATLVMSDLYDGVVFPDASERRRPTPEA